VRKRLTERVRSLAAMTEPTDDAVFVSRDDGDLAWIGRGDGNGTLVEFANADGDVATSLEELASFVRRKDVDGAA
jgi:hypothetical protein